MKRSNGQIGRPRDRCFRRRGKGIDARQGARDRSGFFRPPSRARARAETRRQIVAIVDADQTKLAPFARENGPKLLTGIDQFRAPWMLPLSSRRRTRTSPSRHACSNRASTSSLETHSRFSRSRRTFNGTGRAPRTHSAGGPSGTLQPCDRRAAKTRYHSTLLRSSPPKFFTPRSLDVDVILDLMTTILTSSSPWRNKISVLIRAAGISVLSPKVDIADVRLAFPSGCIANLTASRVSTEKVRKLRLFQPNQYISIDYARQDATSISVRQPGGPARDRLHRAPDRKSRASRTRIGFVCASRAFPHAPVETCCKPPPRFDWRRQFLLKLRNTAT